ncbi:hypothetical protein [Marinoscillum sp.]|uniref:hypothetical protein n=1 Tax=Marinoscillum sp. TaxID=2024838 RepID=UPI003BAB7D5B
MDKKIEGALRQSEDSFELSHSFTDRLIRKIQAKELLKIRFGWIHFAAITGFSIVSMVLLILMMDDSMRDALTSSIGWVGIIVISVVVIQVLDHRLIHKKH